MTTSRISAPNAPSTAVDIVLVHGTFANDAEWINVDSEISAAIKEAFPDACISGFRWSGANSHSARKTAGCDLAKYLKDQQRVAPSNPRIVISHSHGGNVLMYALADDSVKAAVTGCVFLGTPFLRAAKRHLTYYVSTVWAILIMLVALLCQVLISLALGADPFSNRIVEYVMVVAAALAYSRSRNSIAWRLERKQEAFYDYVKVPPLRKPAFVAYTYGDEADLALSTVQKLSAVGLPLFPYLTAFLKTSTVIVGVFLVKKALSFVPWERFGVQGLESEIGFLEQGLVVTGLIYFGAALAFMLVLFLTLMLSLILRSHRFGFGWEGMLSSMLVDVSANIMPESTSSIVPYRAQTNGLFTLKHSAFYSDHATISAVIGWIKETIRGEFHAPQYRPEPLPQRLGILSVVFTPQRVAVVSLCVALYFGIVRPFIPSHDVSFMTEHFYVTHQQPLATLEKATLSRFRTGENGDVLEEYFDFTMGGESTQHCHIRGGYRRFSGAAEVAIRVEILMVTPDATVEDYTKHSDPAVLYGKIEALESDIKNISLTENLIFLTRRSGTFEGHVSIPSSGNVSGKIVVINVDEYNEATLSLRSELVCLRAKE